MKPRAPKTSRIMGILDHYPDFPVADAAEILGVRRGEILAVKWRLRHHDHHKEVRREGMRRKRAEKKQAEARA